MNKNVIFSVIIPTYHRNDLLAKCLDCLAPGVQTLPVEQYEVIITDDGFQSTAEEMIRQQYPWAKWVAGPCRGSAANRNNGVKYAYAQSQWLAFTDDDCLPDPGWLSAFAESTNGSAKALEGAIYPLGNLDQDLAECPVNMTGGCFWSANIAVQKALFEIIGGFDANYPIAAHEDQDLKLRLDTITNITFVPNAYVLHPVRLLSLKQAINRIPKYSRAFAYYASKNQKILGYTNIFNMISFLCKLQIVSFISNLKKLKLKSAVSSVIMLTIGIPITIFYFINTKNFKTT
jgi:GT2 family glycosyltransferase